jgi:hypothetical protein
LLESPLWPITFNGGLAMETVLTGAELALLLMGALGVDDAVSAENWIAGSAGLELQGLSAMRKACEWNSRSCVAYLLESGNSWRAEDSEGLDALAVAAHYGSVEAAKEILARPIEEGDELRWAKALCAGLARPSLAICEELLARLGETPLPSEIEAMAMERALGSKGPRAVRLLLEAGWSPMTLTRRLDPAPRVSGDGRRVVSGASCGGSGRRLSALALATLSGAWPQALALLEAGADATEIYRGGASLVMLAAQGGSAETVAALAKRGADVGALDKSGRSALGWAAAYSGSDGNVLATSALLAAGADPLKGAANAPPLELFAWRWGAAGDIAALCSKCDPSLVLAKARSRRAESGSDPYPLENMAALAQGSARWISMRQAKELEANLSKGMPRGLSAVGRL